MSEEEKICPIMSRHQICYVDDDGNSKFKFSPVVCQKDRCMAWIPERTQVIQPHEGYFGESREFYHSGYCRLIFNNNSWQLVGDVEGCRLIP